MCHARGCASFLRWSPPELLLQFPAVALRRTVVRRRAFVATRHLPRLFKRVDVEDCELTQRQAQRVTMLPQFDGTQRDMESTFVLPEALESLRLLRVSNCIHSLCSHCLSDWRLQAELCGHLSVAREV